LLKRLSKIGLLVFGLLTLDLPNFAQTWTNQGQMANCSGAATGTYTPATGEIPCYRTQFTPVYDPVDGKLVYSGVDAASTLEPEWGNNLYLYDPSQAGTSGTIASGAWSTMWNSPIQATSNGNIVSISRSSNVVTVTVDSSGQTGPRPFITGDTIQIINSTGGATSFNGQFTVTGTSGCTNFLCTSFTYNQTGPNESGNGNVGNVYGPAERLATPVPRHAQALAYDTNRSAIWLWGGVCDTVSNATTIVGLHGGCYDLYKMTKSTNWAWTQVHGFGTSNFSTTEPAMSGSSSSCTNAGNCGWKFNYMGYDPTNDVLVMFGGTWNSSPRNETYEYFPASDTLNIICPAISPSCSPLPSARSAFGNGKIVSIGGGKMFLFGGYPATADTWIYNTTTHTWSQPASANGTNPHPVSESGALYDWDSAISKVVLIDANATGSHTWFFDPVALTWKDQGYVGGPILNNSNSTLPEFQGVYDPAYSPNGGGSFVIWNYCATSNSQCTGGKNYVWVLALPAGVSTPTQVTGINAQEQIWSGGSHPVNNRTNAPVTVGMPILDQERTLLHDRSGSNTT
jgi:Kelch motif